MSTAAAACVRVLGAGSLTGLTHDPRDTPALAPPLYRVLHSGLGGSLAVVLAVAVRLAAVGARG